MPSAERKRVVWVRTTAGPRIGLGHLRRCLTLASALRERGAEVRFLVEGEEAALTPARQLGFDARTIAPGVAPVTAAVDGQALVIDDYAFTGEELSALRTSARRMLVFDDVAERSIDADFLLNGGCNAAELPHRTSPDCRRLVGACYALLRTVFRGRPARVVRPTVTRVLVTFGGADPTHETEHAMVVLREALPGAAVDVVIGPHFARALEPASGMTLHQTPDERVVALMEEADLAVCAGGQTTYELAAMGLPAVAICSAENQRFNLQALAAVPTLMVAERAGVAAAVRALAADTRLRARMAAMGQALVDGHGADRVAAALLEALEASNA